MYLSLVVRPKEEFTAAFMKKINILSKIMSTTCKILYLEKNCLERCYFCKYVKSRTFVSF
jgi:hypothetical protein